MGWVDGRSPEAQKAWEGSQRALSDTAGAAIASVSTEVVDGEPDVLGVVTLQDGTKLYVHRISVPSRPKDRRTRR